MKREGTLANSKKIEKEHCPKCDGEKCPYCFQTGKRLFEIGEPVIWDNQEGSLAPVRVQDDDRLNHVGKQYRVNALSEYPDKSDRYYVGIDVNRGSVHGTVISCTLVFDTNLRRPTAEELEAEAAHGDGL